MALNTYADLLASQDAGTLRAKLANLFCIGGDARRAFSLCRLLARKTGLSYSEIWENAKADAMAIQDA